MQIKESMVATERHHKDTLQQMEHKFFEEKVLVLFHVVEHTVYVICNVLVKNSGLFLTSCDDSVYVLCPNCQNTCQTNSLHWNTGSCETCITQRLVYDYGQMVSGWNFFTKLILICTHKSKEHQVTQTNSSFLFFPFCRWIICLVRNRSLNLHIFVF